MHGVAGAGRHVGVEGVGHRGQRCVVDDSGLPLAELPKSRCSAGAELLQAAHREGQDGACRQAIHDCVFHCLNSVVPGRRAPACCERPCRGLLPVRWRRPAGCCPCACPRPALSVVSRCRCHGAGITCSLSPAPGWPDRSAVSVHHVSSRHADAAGRVWSGWRHPARAASRRSTCPSATAKAGGALLGADRHRVRAARVEPAAGRRGQQARRRAPAAQRDRRGPLRVGRRAEQQLGVRVRGRVGDLHGRARTRRPGPRTSRRSCRPGTGPRRCRG